MLTSGAFFLLLSVSACILIHMSTIHVLPALAQALQLRVAVFELPSGLVAVDLTRSVVPTREGQSLLTLPLHNRKRVSPKFYLGIAKLLTN